MAEIDAGFDLGEFTSSSRLLCAITTRAGRVLWANDRLGRAFGPDAGAATDRPLVELLDPYDRSIAVRELTRLDAAGDEMTFVARLHPVAGGFQASWSCRMGDDGLVYVLGVDVTDTRTVGHVSTADDIVMLDHLTGTANRRTFEEALARQLDRCRREAVPLTVALIDLDDFKRYNDTFGHLAGDAYLVSVAQTLLRRTARTGELAGRFGGDELLALWPGMDATTAQANATDLLNAVRVLDLRDEGQPTKISVSIGGITMVPTADTTGASLLDAADRAMYVAKRRGGDGISWVTDLGSDDGGLVELDEVAGGVVEERLAPGADQPGV